MSSLRRGNELDTDMGGLIELVQEIQKQVLARVGVQKQVIVQKQVLARVRDHGCTVNTPTAVL